MHFLRIAASQGGEYSRSICGEERACETFAPAMKERRCVICGRKIELDEIARELGWDDVTISLVCAKCASAARVRDEPEEEPPRRQ
jgi:hypothetical protein